jgi:hypothetical protein
MEKILKNLADHERNPWRPATGNCFGCQLRFLSQPTAATADRRKKQKETSGLLRLTTPSFSWDFIFLPRHVFA